MSSWGMKMLQASLANQSKHVDDGAGTRNWSVYDIDPDDPFGLDVDKRDLGERKKYKKPKRPCPFCQDHFCDLTRHLKRQHSSEQKVKIAMALPKKQRVAQFDKLRKEGILIYNRKIQGSKSDLIRERRQGNEDLVICCGCQGFFSKRRIYQHKKKCSHKGLCGFKDVAVPQNVSSAGVVSEEFLEKVVSCFRKDEVGNICRSDHAVLLLGDRLWAKSVKKKKRVIMSDMRILGNLIHKMKDVRGSDFLGEDILKRSNFDALKECILKLTTSETGEMKAGLKVSLEFVLKKLVKIMKGQYIMKNMMQEAEEVDLFSSVLSMSWDFIFYTAQVFCESRRNVLRKPGDMPLEKDVQILRNVIISEMNVMVQEGDQVWDKHRFIRLRNLICTRLTLFNARRGGEPARMLLSDWTDAEENAWIDPQLVQNVSDPIEKSLLNQFKPVYQSGKVETESTEDSNEGTVLPTTDVPQEKTCSTISSKDNLEMATLKQNITTNTTKSTKTRRYVQWKEHEYELVKRHFRSYIEESSAGGFKGPLPGKSDLLSFLKQNPILGDHPDTKRIDILKTKIFNERKKYRSVFNYV
ncbi:histone-lysine N-methyltransferase SETD8-A [Elysia marginata]|uniref:Histone-lysine N-methyltransferase SETD8-A n=1 Tax=Elysia marginata TaxID=1093978 RepID=A0AAV4EFW1_9GAST|nr:histone-lysine N-methyltransferase SETD8-A [Elysia marginata]